MFLSRESQALRQEVCTICRHWPVVIHSSFKGLKHMGQGSCFSDSLTLKDGRSTVAKVRWVDTGGGGVGVN